MEQPTDAREVVHLVEFDRLVAEGSPLDLEDGQVYLNTQNFAQEVQFSKLALLSLTTSLELCPNNNFLTT
jgi:hypothetical protein